MLFQITPTQVAPKPTTKKISTPPHGLLDLLDKACSLSPGRGSVIDPEQVCDELGFLELLGAAL